MCDVPFHFFFSCMFIHPFIHSFIFFHPSVERVPHPRKISKNNQKPIGHHRYHATHVLNGARRTSIVERRAFWDRDGDESSSTATTQLTAEQLSPRSIPEDFPPGEDTYRGWKVFIGISIDFPHPCREMLVSSSAIC